MNHEKSTYYNNLSLALTTIYSLYVIGCTFIPRVQKNDSSEELKNLKQPSITIPEKNSPTSIYDLIYSDITNGTNKFEPLMNYNYSIQKNDSSVSTSLELYLREDNKNGQITKNIVMLERRQDTVLYFESDCIKDFTLEDAISDKEIKLKNASIITWNPKTKKNSICRVGKNISEKKAFASAQEHFMINLKLLSAKYLTKQVNDYRKEMEEDLTKKLIEESEAQNIFDIYNQYPLLSDTTSLKQKQDNNLNQNKQYNSKENAKIKESMKNNKVQKKKIQKNY